MKVLIRLVHHPAGGRHRHSLNWAQRKRTGWVSLQKDSTNIRRNKMKKVHVVLYSALLSLVCCACSQAQDSLALPANSDPNARSQVGSNVSGTGTKDYVPLWLSGTKLGNSSIFQGPAGIGIGTTTPAATLDVDGTVNAATSFNLGGTPFAYGSSTSGNSFLGFAGNLTTTGGNNTAIGILALRANTTGNFSTAVGEGALAHNTTGGNTAIGFEAMFVNTKGDSNTAIGLGALEDNITGDFNTATGGGALSNNTVGNGNTAIGLEALDSNGTGSGNTAIGQESLLYNTTGSNNSALGLLAGPDSKSTSLTYATAIGAGGVVSESNALVLGGPLGRAAQVKVGIGTATPANVFTIAQGAGEAIADGWATYSSRRWKTNIETLHDALGKVEQLRGVSYELKTNGKHEVGVIAEEVGAVVPEVVTWDQNGKDAQSVDYSRLTALLIEATKEQQILIREQQEQIAQLVSQVRTIQASLTTSGRNSSEVRTVKADLATILQ
jgi:hypothetical protein